MSFTSISSKSGASALRIFLLTAGSVATTFALACATPFAALAALAAVHMRKSDAVKLMVLVWAASQMVGFGFLGYPHQLDTYAWGIALGMGAVAALLGADAALTRRPLKAEPAQLVMAYVAAFLSFKAVIALWALGLGGIATTLDPMLVARQFFRDGAILIGLFAFYHALRAVGLPAPRPRTQSRLAAA